MVVAAPAAGTIVSVNIFEYRGAQPSKGLKDAKSDTASNNAIGSYKGLNERSNDYSSPYIKKNIVEVLPPFNSSSVDTNRTLNQLFNAWQKKHVELLSDTTSLNANLTSSIGLTESYLKATRSDEDYRKFFATYLLFLKTSFGLIDASKASRLANLIKAFDYTRINSQGTQTFFNKVSSLGLAIY